MVASVNLVAFLDFLLPRVHFTMLVAGYVSF